MSNPVILIGNLLSIKNIENNLFANRLTSVDSMASHKSAERPRNISKELNFPYIM